MQILRDATPEDAEAIARLHVEVWRETYRDMAPPAVFQALDVGARLPRWQMLLTAADGRHGTILAEEDGTLAGFGHYGAPSHPAFGALGEVKNLYVARRFARRGIGRKLLRAMAGRLRQQGYPGVGIGVVVDNHPARSFYEAEGGEHIASFIDPGPNWRSSNVIYAWHGFAAFGCRS